MECFLADKENDEKPLKSRKKEIMKRDIVQFVPFNKFKNCSSERLENEVLAEVPRQVHEYCSTHGIIPKLPESEFTYLYVYLSTSFIINKY